MVMNLTEQKLNHNMLSLVSFNEGKHRSIDCNDCFCRRKWVKVFQMEMLQKEPRSLRQNVHSATL